MSDARTYGLTDRASELLDFLRFCAAEGMSPPTYQEMADNLGLKSKSGIHRLIKQLAERGLVRALPGRHQSVTLVDLYTIALPGSVHARLCASAEAAGRTPDEHVIALIHRHCPDLTPARPSPAPTAPRPFA